MSDLLKLAGRVEAAEGPSRELFEEAFAACYPKPADDCEPAWRPELPRQPIFHAWKTRQIAFQHFVHAEAWLDAALTLVPDAWGYTLVGVPGQGSDAVVRERREDAKEPGKFWTGNHMARGEAKRAATPALALTAAALRARASS